MSDVKFDLSDHADVMATWLEGQPDIPPGVVNTLRDLAAEVRALRARAREGGIMDDVQVVWEKLVENALKQPDGTMPTALVVQMFDALAAEVRALRKDRERLDWLANQSEPSWSLFFSSSWQTSPELRTAIDAAMAREGEA